MEISNLNNLYLFTLLISLAGVLSAIAILWYATFRDRHYFKDHGCAYTALLLSLLVNAFFIHNILLWFSEYKLIEDSAFHIRWLAYHTAEKTATLLFHLDLLKHIREWRNFDVRATR